MVSLNDFSNLPRPGEISLYEKDGRLCSLPSSEVDLSNFSALNLSSYPEINISRELCNYSSVTHDDNKTVLMPVYEPIVKQLTRTFIENGLVAALDKTANSETDCNVIVISLAKFALRVINVCNSIQYYYHPYHGKEHGVFSISKFSQTREWPRSLIRVIRWHPNVFKLAIAACDDSIRIYTDEKTNPPVLKNVLQKCITCLAWRPLTHGELAVGCQNGILVWNITNMRTTKPTRLVHLSHSNHSPVISVEWDKVGNILASASTNDSDILIWNVDLQCNEPLKRVGPPSSLLKFSPDGSKMFASTVGSVFRVWNTQNWTPERWTVPNGTIQSAVWSPCGGYMLFITSEESILYSLQFIEQQLFATTSLAKQALPIADLSKIKIDGRTEVGGQPQSIVWDAKGQHLAVSFKDSPAIALFFTAVNKNMINIAPDCFVTGIGTAFPSYICFQEIYKQKSQSVLTIGWSNGIIQYFPFI